MRPASELEEGKEGRPGELLMMMVMTILYEHDDTGFMVVVISMNLTMTRCKIETQLCFKTYPAILNEMHGEKSFLLPLAESWPRKL